jgi:hypothetical protein
MPAAAPAFAIRFERLQKAAENPSFANEDAVTRAAFARSRKFDMSHNFAGSLRTLIAGIEARLAASR